MSDKKYFIYENSGNGKVIIHAKDLSMAEVNNHFKNLLAVPNPPKLSYGTMEELASLIKEGKVAN